MHSAFYRLKDTVDWMIFSEIGNYIVKNSTDFDIVTYLEDFKDKRAGVVMFNRTYLGYMFNHRHRANVNDTNLDIFTKEPLIKGTKYVPSDLFRLEFAANSHAVKTLALRRDFIFSKPTFRKMTGAYDSVRIVPRERFNMIYGNESGNFISALMFLKIATNSSNIL